MRACGRLARKSATTLPMATASLWHGISTASRSPRTAASEAMVSFSANAGKTSRFSITPHDVAYRIQPVHPAKTNPQDNRLNCPGRRSEPVRPWSCAAATKEAGRPQGFQHGGSREDGRGPPSRMEIALRANRIEPFLRGPRRPPCFLRVEILPGLRMAHVSPVVGSNSGFKRLPWTNPLSRKAGEAGRGCNAYRKRIYIRPP